MRRARVATCVALVFGCTLPGVDRSSPKVAEGGGVSITLGSLDERVKEVLFEERTRGKPNEVYDLRAGVLEEMIEDRVLAAEAKRQGLTVEALIDAEAAPVTDEELAEFFEKNRESFPANFELDDVVVRLREYLEDQNRKQATRALVEQAGVSILLEPPRVDVAALGPARGPDDAPITIVEFSDFQCPFCRRAGPILDEVLRRYPQDVRLVFRHLPLESIHPRARAAAEASGCAHDQGRFWEFHDRVFESQQALTDADLREHAEALGLELEVYDACVTAHTHREGVTADVEAAQAAGISSTPAFVINGVLLKGARPVGAFERLIDRELQAVAAAP
jgi:protein-disulfide isomerase